MLGIMPSYTSSGYLAHTSYLAMQQSMSQFSAKPLELHLVLQPLGKELQFRQISRKLSFCDFMLGQKGTHIIHQSQKLAPAEK